MLAMCVMALSAPSFAQDAPKKDDAVEEVVVTVAADQAIAAVTDG